MPHKPTLREGGCRIKVLSKKPDAACMPDAEIRIMRPGVIL